MIVTVKAENPKQKFTTATAADYTGMSEAYFRCGRYTGKPGLPPYYKIGRKIFYLREDLDIWLQQYRIEQP